MRKNSEICLICGKSRFKNANGFAKHLRVHKISTKDYYLFYIDHTEGICEVCNKEVQFSSIDKGFPDLCRVCNNKHNPQRIQKIKETVIKKYGVENASQVEEFQEKKKQTNIKRYGVEYAQQHPNIIKKCLDTWKEKYEGGHPGRDPKIKKQKKKTCQDKYGFDNPSQVKEFKEKRKQTNLRRHGNEYAMCNSIIRKRFEDTLKEKYGVCNILQHPDFLEKAKKTNQKNRGVDWPMQDPEVVRKISGSNSYRWIEDRQQRFSPYSERFFNEEYRNQIRNSQNNLDPLSGEILKDNAHLHHIDYDKTNDARKNLIFLNRSNHFKTNTNRGYWKNLLEDINQLYI